MPLEVFHYHKAIINTNFKLWHDTNSEFYHDYLHYFNRVTGMLQPGYFDRKYVGYPNGHASVGSMTIRYDAYEGGKDARRRLAGPCSRRMDLGRHFSGHDLQPAHVGVAHGHLDSARAEQAADRVSWSGAEERHARTTRRACARSQPDLGAFRSQPARRLARRAWSGPLDASWQRSRRGFFMAARKT